MTADELRTTLCDIYPGLYYQFAYAEHTYYYNPEGILRRGVYFCTVKERDGPKDRLSQLDREGVYRLSFGVGRSAYIRRFGPPPARPAKGDLLALPIAFTALGVLTPHPVYAWMSWVAINSPTEQVLENVLGVMDEAYASVQQRYTTRIRRETR